MQDERLPQRKTRRTVSQGAAATSPHSASIRRAGVVIALQRLVLVAATRETLVLEGRLATPLPARTLWATWSDLARWPCWSPMHRAATWITAPGWRHGARFEQLVDRPAPLGLQREVVTVERVEPESTVVWTRMHAGVRECHVWRFDPLQTGGTLVCDVHVMLGPAMQVLGPMLAPAWRQQDHLGLQHLFSVAADAAAQHRDGE